MHPHLTFWSDVLSVLGSPGPAFPFLGAGWKARVDWSLVLALLLLLLPEGAFWINRLWRGSREGWEEEVVFIFFFFKKIYQFQDLK